MHRRNTFCRERGSAREIREEKEGSRYILLVSQKMNKSLKQIYPIPFADQRMIFIISLLIVLRAIKHHSNTYIIEKHVQYSKSMALHSSIHKGKTVKVGFK